MYCERLAKYRTTDRFKEYLRVYSKNYRINDSFKERARIILRSEVRGQSQSLISAIDVGQFLYTVITKTIVNPEVMWLCMIAIKWHTVESRTQLMHSLATKGDI